FRIGHGAYLRAVSYSGVLGSGVADAGTMWVGLLNMSNRTGAGHASIAADSFAGLLAVPAEYLASEPLAGIDDQVNVIKWKDTLIVGYSGSNTILFADTSGQLLDSISIPVVRRRGVPPDIVQRLAPGVPFPEMFAMNSALFKLARLSDGALLAVHYDQTIDGRRIRSKAYLSLVSADRRRACVDVPLAVSEDAQPRVAVAGDSLYVLEQHVMGDSATATVRSFRIAIEPKCSWVQLDRSHS
ncbi:MAG TPA: hypothetical protein VFL95_10350, partial [Gemmatimonadales bacterium]|nr:hypothetical protein [Gemmatimonadales bacterium]